MAKSIGGYIVCPLYGGGLYLGESVVGGSTVAGSELLVISLAMQVKSNPNVSTPIQMSSSGE